MSFLAVGFRGERAAEEVGRFARALGRGQDSEAGPRCFLFLLAKPSKGDCSNDQYFVSSAIVPGVVAVVVAVVLLVVMVVVVVVRLGVAELELESVLVVLVSLVVV